MKAVVLEIKDRNAAVLTADGRFLSVPDVGYGPGLEIELPDSLIEADASGEEEEDLPEEELFDTEPETGVPGQEGGTLERPGAGGNIFFLKDRREKKQRNAGKTAGRGRAGRLRRFAAAAAAALVVSVSAGGMYTYAQPYGVVSIDVNPSIEYTINRFDRVLSARAVNEEGEEVLDSLDLTRLRHRSIDRAMEDTLRQLEAMDYLKVETAGAGAGESSTAEASSEEAEGSRFVVVLGMHTRDEAHSARLRDGLERKMSREFGGRAEIFAEVVSEEEAREARELGTTPGKLRFVEKMLGPEGAAPFEMQDSRAGEGSVPEEFSGIDEADLREWTGRPVREILHERDRRFRGPAEELPPEKPEEKKPGQNAPAGPGQNAPAGPPSGGPPAGEPGAANGPGKPPQGPAGRFPAGPSGRFLDIS